MEYSNKLVELADQALVEVFGVEWVLLERGRKEILQDFIEADISASEYLDRIYRGNLESYAATLLAGRKS